MFKKDFIGKYTADFWQSSTVIEGTVFAGYPVKESADHVPAATDTHATDDKAKDEYSGGHHDIPLWVLWSPFTAMALGFAFSYWLYILHPGRAKKWANQSRFLHPFLYNKWYFDELYDAVLVKNVKRLGDLLWKTGDQKLVDGLGPNGFAALTAVISRKAAKLQSGYVYHYAFVMLIGLVGFVTWSFMRGLGGH